jgi:hypothetical protein
MILNQFLANFFVPTGPWVNRFFLTLMRCTQRIPDVASRTVTRKKPTTKTKLIESGAIKRQSLALRIGTKRAASIWPFFPVQSKPAQVLDHGTSKLWIGAFGIQIFISKNQNTVRIPSSLPRDPKCAGMA